MQSPRGTRQAEQPAVPQPGDQNNQLYKDRQTATRQAKGQQINIQQQPKKAPHREPEQHLKSDHALRQAKQTVKAPPISPPRAPPGFPAPRHGKENVTGQELPSQQQQQHGAVYQTGPRDNSDYTQQAQYGQKQPQHYPAPPYQPHLQQHGHMDPTIAQMFMQQQIELQKLTALVQQQQQGQQQQQQGQYATGHQAASGPGWLSASFPEETGYSGSHDATRAQKVTAPDDRTRGAVSHQVNPHSSHFPNVQGARVSRPPMRMKKGISDDEMSSYTCPITQEVTCTFVYGSHGKCLPCCAELNFHNVLLPYIATRYEHFQRGLAVSHSVGPFLHLASGTCLMR